MNLKIVALTIKKNCFIFAFQSSFFDSLSFVLLANNHLKDQVIVPVLGYLSHLMS